MSLTENMQQLLADMSSLNQELIKKTGGPAGADTIVAYAPNADKLDGMTAGRVSDLLRERVRAHIQTLSQNAHNTLPEDLGTYSDEEFTTRLDGLLNIDGDGPLSFYGDREYLPPTVTGSFESGVNWAPWGYVGMFLEDNGTLMMLRTGTDGVRAGVYYSYLRDALNTTQLSNIVMTNSRYHPAYFPTGSVARSVLWANQDLIIGMLHNQTTLEITGYFISLTNNTYDQTKHTGIVIPPGIIDVSITSDCVMRGQPIAFLKGNTVYLLVNKNDVDYTSSGWKVYSIPKSQLVNSSYQGATPITGWTINRGVKGVVSRTDLDWADDKYDLLALAKPSLMTTQEVHRHNPSHYAKTEDDGRMVLLHTHYFAVYDDTKLVNYVGFTGHFTFDFDPVNKVIDVSKYFNQKIPLSINDANTAWVIGDSPGSAHVNTPSNVMTYDMMQCSARLYLSENNVVFFYRTSVLFTNRQLYRVAFPADADPRDILRGAVSGSNIAGSNYEGRFASPVSFLPSCVANIGDNVLVGLNTGWSKSNVVQRMWFRAGTSGGFTYRYGSLQGYKFLGNPPTSDRAWLTDYPASNQSDMYGAVNETDASGYRVHKARYCSLVLNRRSGAANIDTAVNGTGTVSITPATFDGLEAPLRTMLTSAIKAAHPAYTNLWYEVVVPQRYTDLPAFVYGHWLDSDRRTHFFVCSLNVNNRAAITSVTLAPSTLIHDLTRVDTVSIGLGLGANAGDSGQVAIRKVNVGFLVGLISTTRYSYIGNTVATNALLSWKPGAGWAFAANIDYDQQAISNTGWVNLSSGLYMTFTAENHRVPMDCGTKLMATLVSNGGDPAFDNLDSYRTRMTQDAYARVLLSQQTVTAWTVYFADPTPVMIEGQYYELGVYAHYLNAATDGNKKFYCWVTKLSGVVAYHVTTDPGIPTGFDASLYIGYFTTDANGLSAVAVEKRVAVGGVLISPSSRGNSIPVTSGVPNTAGRLNWR